MAAHDPGDDVRRERGESCMAIKDPEEGRPISARGQLPNGPKIRKLFARQPATIEGKISISSERRTVNEGASRWHRRPKIDVVAHLSPLRRASGVVLIEAPSLTHARTQASLEARFAGLAVKGGLGGR
jgi:hypothetical protein